ncbi:DUF6265 family protein [Shewanella basaltis]|jgi:hypothetical protein|uniref:DUF6265 family protein n=1 Tax=Shewanella basaltis TaxID=472183 RepID=UPI003AAC2DE5
MKLILFGLLTLLSHSALATQCENISVLQGLLGVWQSVHKQRIVQEQWQQVSSNTFEGSGETFTEQWKHNESLHLLSMPEGIFYVATVAHNPLPVAFKLTQCEQTRLVFENSAHDFPNKIEYDFIDHDHLIVKLSGQHSKGVNIKFTRLKDKNKAN